MERVCLLVITVILACASLSWAKPESVDHGADAHKVKHVKDGVHNPVFDLEALFGSRNNDDLNELADDVRSKRLSILAKSHDTNNDDIIEPEELKAWVLQSFRMLDHEEGSEKFAEDDEDSDGRVTFVELIHKQFGYTEEDIANIEAKHKGGSVEGEEAEEELEIIRLITDDRKRFEAADLDNDKALDKSEYLAYFQPYDHPHMFQLEMERAVGDMDKDKDSFISIEEFIGDNDDEEARLAEQTNFEELDKDKDGKLTQEELRPWALPDNSDIADEEVEHLMKECDENGDGKLSVDEIVSKEDEFLGSSTTDYGRHLHFVKDEL